MVGVDSVIEPTQRLLDAGDARVVERCQQLLRLRPRDARCGGLPGRTVGVAEVHKQIGDEKVVVQGPGQSEAVLVAVGCWTSIRRHR